MLFALEIKEEAEKDIALAFSWYEDQLTGLGYRFMEALEERLNDIATHPSHYGFISEDYRKIYRDVKLKKFPYLVVYQIEKDKVIVLSVFHARDNPLKKQDAL